MLQFPNPSWYWDTVTKICVFLFAFVVPILVITVCYGLMLLRLRSVRLLSGSKEKDRSLRRHHLLIGKEKEREEKKKESRHLNLPASWRPLKEMFHRLRPS